MIVESRQHRQLPDFLSEFDGRGHVSARRVEIDRELVVVRAQEPDQLQGVGRRVLVDRAVDRHPGGVPRAVEVVDGDRALRCLVRFRLRGQRRRVRKAHEAYRAHRRGFEDIQHKQSAGQRDSGEAGVYQGCRADRKRENRRIDSAVQVLWWAGPDHSVGREPHQRPACDPCRRLNPTFWRPTELPKS